MVKIISTKLTKNNDGKEFVSLKLQGEVEAIQSQQTGKFYLTAKTCYISCTFSFAQANALVGSDIPGCVERISSEPYQYTIKESGEVITLSHRYEFVPESKASRMVHAEALVKGSAV